jgi:hypothetical protein
MRVHIQSLEEDDVNQIDSLARSLQDDVSNLDVDKITLITETPPPGSKAFDGVAIGSMIIDFATGGVVKQITQTIQAWIQRNENRSITLEIEDDKIDVKGISGKDQQKIIDAWIMRQMQKMSVKNG